MQTREDKVFYVRMDGDMAESVSIMSGLLGQLTSEYIREAVAARLSEDVPANLPAYEAVRQTRVKKAQEKGA